MGSSIPSISKDELGQVKIPLPPIEKQIDIVRLQDLWFAERRLLEALIGEKERFYQTSQ